MNTNFGKLNDGVLTYAPSNIRIGNVRYYEPTAEQYAACGYLPLVTETPTKVGVTFVPDGWEERDGAIHRTFTETPIVAPTKRYAVEEIIYGLITRNALQAVKQIVGDYWELFTMRDSIAADNEIWAAQLPELKAAIVASGALTDSEFDAVLADAEVV